LMLFLVGMAYADGQITSAEMGALTRVANSLGISNNALQRTISMAAAQANFGAHRQRRKYRSEKNQLTNAYKALGVSSSVDDRELKKVFRRLMSENHPDKLSARGVPKEMIDLATERSQSITAAYDLIKAARGLK